MGSQISGTAYESGVSFEAEVKEISIADSKEHLVRPAYAVLDNFILRIIDVYEMPKWKQSLEEYIAEWKEETHE